MARTEAMSVLMVLPMPRRSVSICGTTAVLIQVQRLLFQTMELVKSIKLVFVKRIQPVHSSQIRMPVQFNHCSLV